MGGMESKVDNVELALETLKVFAWVHALYWFFALICPYVFKSTYNNLDAGKQSYWAASLVSCVMSNVIAYKTFSLAFEHKMYWLYFEYDHLWTDVRARELCIIISGYFLSDLTVAFYYHDKWPGYMANYIHHIVGMYSFLSLAKWDMGHGLALSSFLLEITNLFGNIRWFLDTAKMKETHKTLYLANGIMFTLGFATIRVWAFTNAGIHYIFKLREQLWSLPLPYIIFVHATYSVAIGLQYFWMYKIGTGLYKMLTGKGKKKSV